MNLFKTLFRRNQAVEEDEDLPLPQGVKTKNDLQDYYLNGYAIKSFPEPASHQRLLEVLSELDSRPLREGFEWQEKYPRSTDLRPSVHAYDNVFLDVLFENRIPELVKETTGLDLTLLHIQLTKALPGSRYKGWHRDTSIYDGEVCGNIPPVHKVIFYPQLGAPKKPVLYVSPGSQHRIKYQKKKDLEQAKTGPQITVYNDNQRFLLFNTSLLHRVAPEENPNGQFRLFYIFCHAFQLARYPNLSDLHEKYQMRFAGV